MNTKHDAVSQNRRTVLAGIGLSLTAGIAYIGIVAALMHPFFEVVYRT